MTSLEKAARILGTDGAGAEKVAPLLSDAASALAEVSVPSEAEIHELVSGSFKFDESGVHESQDMERKMGEAMKNLSRWRERAQVFLNGASVLLRRTLPDLTRFEAKKRVLGAFRFLHTGTGSERFYFTREGAIELPPDLASRAKVELAPAALRGKSFQDHPAYGELVRTRPGDLTHEQIGLLLRLLSLVVDPKAGAAADLVALLVRCGDRAGPCVLGVMSRPDESAKSVGGETGAMLIGIRRLLPRLPQPWCERILRSALEAGWSEWLDRPLLDPPLDASLRERLMAEYGTRQESRGNPYRPTEPWFYNLDPS